MHPDGGANEAQWTGMTLTVANRLLEHLSPSDIRLVADATGKAADAPSSWIVAALAEESVHDAVFGITDAPFSVASPFLVFTVAVHGIARELADATLTNVAAPTRIAGSNDRRSIAIANPTVAVSTAPYTKASVRIVAPMPNSRPASAAQTHPRTPRRMSRSSTPPQAMHARPTVCSQIVTA
jgi:hypothetical protein